MAKQNDLKFRVWDDRDRHWANPIDRALNCDGELLAPNAGGKFYETYRELSPDELSHFHVYLCSGIEDSFGDLIYEGDILEFVGRSKAIVYYKNGAFKIRYLGAAGYGWEFLANVVERDLFIGVIGNIRENPELVKCQESIAD